MQATAATGFAARPRAVRADTAIGLPPGPEAGVFAQTVVLHRDPLGVLRRAQARHGDVFTLRLLTVRPLVIVSDPGLTSLLLEADPAKAHAGEARRRVLPFASPRSIFGADEAQHRAARHRVADVFTPEAMEGRRPRMAEIATRHVGSWPRGRPFRLLSRMRAVTDEIFVRLVLGVRKDPTATALTSAIGRMLRTPGNPPFTLPGEGDGLAGRAGMALFERRQAPVARWLGRAVEERRADPEGHDVLGSMVRAHPSLSTDEIVDELMSTLMAAQEPPAIALTWILDRLSREPERGEEFASAPESPNADALVRETLRLNPPAAGVLRRLTEPLKTEACVLPAGATVMVPLALVQRDARGYDAPDDFRPERWLGIGEPAGPLIPFGGGARRCVGEHLARAEIASVIPAVLRAVRLRPLWPRPERMVLRGTAMVPHRSALAISS